VGYLFLKHPPVEKLPIPDFRTISDVPVTRPSPDLLDTIYLAQQRQEWFASYARRNGFEPLSWVGSLTVATPITEAATTIRDEFDIGIDARKSTWAGTFQNLSLRAEAAGVLVMVSGVVGSNTHRRLNPEEFRGFALVDPLAPVAFVNATDSKAAQIFTLTHELAHLWLGQSGLDNASVGRQYVGEIESWCNEVAAEILVPLAEIRDFFNSADPLANEVDRLARHFKVSTLVVLRRIHEAGFLEWNEFRAQYVSERERVLGLVSQQTGDGGNFYYTQPVRVSKSFAQAVIRDTFEGTTTYKDAFYMLGIRKTSTLQNLADQLGVR